MARHRQQGAAGEDAGRRGSAEARFPAGDARTSGSLARALCQQLTTLPRNRRQRVVLLCIGSDRSTGDALGPIVGMLLRDGGWGEPGRTPGGALRRCGVVRLTVCGTLDHPVHAGNLAQTLRSVSSPLAKPVIVAIDACLGRPENVGSIAVGPGPLRPGAGVNKDLPAVGDVFVTGTVNVAGFMEYVVLQNTRLSLVMGMARVIAGGVLAALGDVAWQRPSPGAPTARGVLLPPSAQVAQAAQAGDLAEVADAAETSDIADLALARRRARPRVGTAAFSPGR